MKKIILLLTLSIILTGCGSSYEGKTAETWANSTKTLIDASNAKDKTISDLQEKLKESQDNSEKAEKDAKFYEALLEADSAPRLKNISEQTDILFNCINNRWDKSLDELNDYLQKKSDTTPEQNSINRNYDIARCKAVFLLNVGVLKQTTLGEACKEDPNSSPECKKLN